MQDWVSNIETFLYGARSKGGVMLPKKMVFLGYPHNYHHRHHPYHHCQSEASSSVSSVRCAAFTAWLDPGMQSLATTGCTECTHSSPFYLYHTCAVRSVHLNITISHLCVCTVTISVSHCSALLHSVQPSSAPCSVQLVQCTAPWATIEIYDAC